jgi:hypothetical protein
MKKIIYLAIAFISLNAITSCSKDDENQASFEGKWEYLKEGVATGGQEVLVDYVHETGCTRDYSIITATAIADYEYFGNTCNEDITITNYTRSGNTISTTVEGQTFTATIKTLNSSTLKVYFADPENPEISEVTVFKRIN